MRHVAVALGPDKAVVTCQVRVLMQNIFAAAPRLGDCRTYRRSSALVAIEHSLLELTVIIIRASVTIACVPGLGSAGELQTDGGSRKQGDGLHLDCFKVSKSLSC